jgi:hypothetical protein
MALIIKTDNKWKHFKYGYEVPKRILKNDFAWLDDSENIDGFIKYKRGWTHLSNFMRAPSDIKPWQGIENWSFSNGLLIQVSSDGERYKVAYYYTVSD